MFGPRQRDEDVVALLEPGTSPGLAPLQSDPQVGGQPQGRMGVTVGPGPGDGLPVGVRRVFPHGVDPSVVEGRFAIHEDFDGAAHAANRAQQDVLGVPIHRCAAVRTGAGVEVMPRTHHQGVAHDHPARRGLPRGFHDQAARKIPARRRHRHPVGPDPEMPGAAVEHRAEHARRIRPGHAHPLHRTGRGDQAGVFAVGEECVVGDRRKRAAPGSARDVGKRLRHVQRAGATVPGPAVLGGCDVQNHPDIIAGETRVVHRMDGSLRARRHRLQISASGCGQ